MNFIAVY